MSIHPSHWTPLLTTRALGRAINHDGDTLTSTNLVLKDMARQGKTLYSEEAETHKLAMMALVKEAERVVREMPAWEPAFIDKDKTKPCTVKFAMPIMFRLR